MPSKELLETLGKGIALFGLLFTVGTFFYNQNEKRAQERYEATRQLIDEYVADGILEKETALAVRLLHFTSQIDLNDEDTVPDEVFDPLARMIVFAELDGAPLPEAEPELFNMLAILDYYGRVEFCMRAGVCETAVASTYFCPRIIEFTTANKRMIGYIDEYLSSERRFADVENLLTHCQN